MFVCFCACILFSLWIFLCCCWFFVLSLFFLSLRGLFELFSEEGFCCCHQHPSCMLRPSIVPTLSTNAVLLEYRKHHKPQSSGGNTSRSSSIGSQRVPDGAIVVLENEENASDEFSVREAMSPANESRIVNTKKNGGIEKGNGQQRIAVDWDWVNHETELKRVNSNISSVPRVTEQQENVSFLDAVRLLKNDRYTWEPYVSSHRFSENEKSNCVMSLLERLRDIFCWCRFSYSRDGIVSSEPKSILHHDTEFTLTLPCVPFDHSYSIHRRLLITIYHNLCLQTKNGSSNAGTRPGAIDWEVLGFQGSDPATDLRFTGILGLLQIVYLIEYYKDFAMLLWNTCTNGGSGLLVYEELPFVLVGFNFSAVLLDMLKDSGFYADLTRRAQAIFCSKARAGRLSIISDNEKALRHEFPLLFVCCEYHVGCLFLFWECWHGLKTQRDGKQPTIGDFGVVKAKLCTKLKKNGPQYAFDACAKAGDPFNAAFHAEGAVMPSAIQ
ncbi:hypothetical protein MOQ_003678 [Trypanosoma cruzi marinkellei]|uniref:ELMO domain-containing protein n=1 Tax=Trypanosoma cruzi marinkellei TaxID=85056 RepID=K2MZH0_TRYCR|nr:hypothetical protein MOQ_003678 [Trypanosoma cruzi marinkellei]